MQGKIVKVAGPLVVADGMDHAGVADVVRVGEEGLIGEILNLDGDRASIQVYEETTMLMLQVRYTLQEGKDPAAFVHALEQADIPARTRAETGCCQYEFFYSASSPNEVLLLEAWADEIAQQAHKGTAQCAELQKVKAQYVADVSFRQYTAE